jgi:hypothetical protein
MTYNGFSAFFCHICQSSSSFVPFSNELSSPLRLTPITILFLSPSICTHPLLPTQSRHRWCGRESTAGVSLLSGSFYLKQMSHRALLFLF